MRPGRFTLATLMLLLVISPPCLRAKGKASHVMLVVCDGLQPEFVTERDAPNLSALRRNGVFFARNHAVYPSSTNVNGAALATGSHPLHTGIIGNMEFRPAIDPHRPVDTAEGPDVLQGNTALLAHYLLTPTLPEILHQAGERTAIAGSKPVAQLFDRARDRQTAGAKESVVLYRGKILPLSEAERIQKTIGPFPVRDRLPNEKQDLWTTRALTEILWKNGVPKFSLLWLSEPDLTEHDTAPGSPETLAAIRSSDEKLGRVIAALKEKRALTTTDVLVVADHGFSTIDLAVDVAERLRGAGFDAVRVFADRPPRGQVLVVSLGGSVELYVAEHDQQIIERLLEFLQQSDFAGVIFTCEAHPGSFTFAQAMLPTRDAPDILVACRWKETPNEFGVPGAIASDIGHTAGQGSHATLSPFDMHNTLLVSGPDFRQGWVDESPTGNIDLAPTIAAILGLPTPEKMDGRILSEAFRDGKPAPPAASHTLESRNGAWHQTLRLTTVGETTYLVEGNGGKEPTKP